MIAKSKKMGEYLLLGIMVVGCIGLAATKSLSSSLDGDTEAKVEAFIKDFDAVSKEMESAIASDSTTAGIDSAQKAFDAKKNSLREMFNGFKNARSEEVSSAVLKKLTDSITNNGKMITDAFVKHEEDYADEPGAGDKFRSLMKEYSDIFAM